MMDPPADGDRRPGVPHHGPPGLLLAPAPPSAAAAPPPASAASLGPAGDARRPLHHPAPDAPAAGGCCKFRCGVQVLPALNHCPQTSWMMLNCCQPDICFSCVSHSRRPCIHAKSSLPALLLAATLPTQLFVAAWLPQNAPVMLAMHAEALLGLTLLTRAWWTCCCSDHHQRWFASTSSTLPDRL